MKTTDKKRTSGTQSKLWGTLSELEKQEVISAYEESKDEANLIAHEQVMNKYGKWLEK